MKYCVPRGSPDAGETGVGALATTVAGDGAMTGRKMNPPAKPIAKVTIKTMIALLCDMVLNSQGVPDFTGFSEVNQKTTHASP